MNYVNPIHCTSFGAIGLPSYEKTILVRKPTSDGQPASPREIYGLLGILKGNVKHPKNLAKICQSNNTHSCLLNCRT